MNNPKCDNCGQNMILAKKFETKKRGKGAYKVRLRRFHCVYCDIYKTIFSKKRS